jgi:hypothetical protein
MTTLGHDDQNLSILTPLQTVGVPAGMRLFVDKSVVHGVSLGRLTAIRRALQLSVAEDVDRGIPLSLRVFCHACGQGRPAPGFSRYAAYQVCNRCATEFEVAQMWAESPTIGQFVRDKQFGEAAYYALLDLEVTGDVVAPSGE